MNLEFVIVVSHDPRTPLCRLQYTFAVVPQALRQISRSRLQFIELNAHFTFKRRTLLISFACAKQGMSFEVDWFKKCVFCTVPILSLNLDGRLGKKSTSVYRKVQEFTCQDC